MVAQISSIVAALLWVERNDEPEIDEDKTKPNNNSTTAGLIKIVFIFYQTHSLLTVYKSNRETQYLGDLKALVLTIINLNAITFKKWLSLTSPWNGKHHKGMD